MRGSGAAREFMSPETGHGVVLKCPITSPFLPNLAAAVLAGSIWNRGAPEPHELPQLTIYLPTLAAVEPLKLAFLAHANNGATFLPRIRVLGEADPLDLFAAYGPRMASATAALGLLEQALAIPAAYDELERQTEFAALAMQASQALLGTRLTHEPLFANLSAASAFIVAGQIAALIGEAHTEGADLSRAGQLDSTRASGTEQLSLQLLRNVLRGWQAHKAKAGKLDREERRNRLMAIEAEFIRQSDAPVIVAGSTGSVAATVGLMEAALAKPQSAIVLYGLDGSLGESSAAAGEHPEHPQHGLELLLARLNIRREDIRDLARPPHPSPLPEGKGRESATLSQGGGLSSGVLSPLGERDRVRGDSDDALRRALFLSEALRPAPATAQWAPFIQSLRQQGGHPAPGLALIEAETVQDEAGAIALILRESLETQGQTAAFATPSESLLARVRHALAQWGLAAEAPGTCAANALSARAVSCAASAKPEDLAELLRLAQGAASASIWRTAEIIDLGVLRQMWRPSSMAGIPAALSRAEHAVASGEARQPAMKRVAAVEWDAARAFATEVLEALSPLIARGEKCTPLPGWIAAHRAVLSNLARLGIGGGTPEHSVLDKLERASARGFMLDLTDYAGFFAEVIATQREKTLESPHPRLFLMKPFDARLLTADVMILGGLNEGCWPQMPGPDPWLNRRDRAFVGLPPKERRIGQAAHEFVSLAASAPRVILTRSKKENGSLARPSRWISRIQALAGGAGQLQSLQPERPWLDWLAAHRTPEAAVPIGRPQPRPPLAARPRRLSVTAIETWLANPYAIYARHILSLVPLRHPGETSDARDKGILYHAALHGFFEAYPNTVPENAAAELLRNLDKAAEELGFNLENAPFWRPRFARFAEWFAGTENERRAGVQILKSEVGGKLRVEAPAGPFEITARADRIDRLEDGALRIYDFKTSANAAKVSSGRGAPQLALEGLLAKEGAFTGIPAGSQAELFYIVATGGEPPGEIVTPKMPGAEAIEAARAGVLRQIARFDDEATAYEYQTRAIFRDKSEHDPYAHLARVREWAVEAEESEAGDD
ncbi:MAG: PD-(D/E)XK nuclease family protein [Rhodomicrobium sp.]